MDRDLVNEMVRALKLGRYCPELFEKVTEEEYDLAIQIYVEEEEDDDL